MGIAQWGSIRSASEREDFASRHVSVMKAAQGAPGMKTAAWAAENA
jgi:hypothetical protein